ncbi:GNAT family N-acetyltransferase [Ferrovibrio terrae]|uniref:GNAT family N-acetyltransferase n=1 Tax=Ferrovibrio terrae TaxID=2594003 RepID=A0A516H104_9PROT|nr:GNAT family N-acetyltransferase [Ferrovibrio terrae]QDO97436.1 GNAT family N-acetyltransferase [Ferrovibrio terrae]
MVSIAIENPDQPDIVALLRAADDWYATLYPAESNHLLDVSTLQQPGIAFFVARDDGELLGFGAVADRGDYAEIKRMYLAPAARGRKLGRRILQALERHAAQGGQDCCRLETGIHQPEAIGLYRSAGYQDVGPFGSYGPDPLSLFMEKRL